MSHPRQVYHYNLAAFTKEICERDENLWISIAWVLDKTDLY